MRNILVIFTLLLTIGFASSCLHERPDNSTSDRSKTEKTEQLMQEANAQIGMPAITNFQELRLAKEIYELRDRADLICHAYLMNEMTGEVGQYLGKCIGYGLPFSVQFSNPEKLVDADRALYDRNYSGLYPMTVPQPEPNGLFMPEGLSATWIALINPETNEPEPVYMEPTIIISPFPLHHLKATE